MTARIINRRSNAGYVSLTRLAWVPVWLLFKYTFLVVFWLLWWPVALVKAVRTDRVRRRR